MNPSIPTPLERLLEALHREIKEERSGAVASYIPELTQADPEWFGIALVTVDGRVYQVGDTRQGFTIQSISKVITYGLALADRGVDGVLAKVGVEPSGEAFNSISLDPATGQPRNPMINAGAIATCGLVAGNSVEERLERLLGCYERYTGRRHAVDETVYRSEMETGHRNRAIAHLLRNFGIIERAPDEVLDLYFRQCSISVDCRDLALIGACLANGGVNPITHVRAVAAHDVPRLLSIMASCGMYDYSGAWIYTVGMPAKSGVGGGIVAVLPGQFGIGIFSPRLDARGNSVRGTKVCERLSAELGLHLFNAMRGSSSSALRVSYSAAEIASRKSRPPQRRTLLTRHGGRIRVYRLQGELTVGAAESLVGRILAESGGIDFAVLDLHQVSAIDEGSTRLFAGLVETLHDRGIRALFTDTEDKYLFVRALGRLLPGLDTGALTAHPDADRALAWCEDQLLARLLPAPEATAPVGLADHPLCRGLLPAELAAVTAAARAVRVAAGATLFSAGDPAHSLFLLSEGELEVALRTGPRNDVRLATLIPGMSFGEMALVNQHQRSADVRALQPSLCYEVPFESFDDAVRLKLLANLATELSEKLLARELERTRLE